MSILDSHDGLLLDLDGTVWEGGVAIEHAVSSIGESGLPVVYVTNNASRSAKETAQMLQAAGLPASEKDVLTSAQASIAMAQGVLSPGSKVLVVGADSFRDLARNAGFEVVYSADEHPESVFQGFSKDVGWEHLTEAALSLRQGAKYFVSNLDSSLPTERGLAIGNGALVAAVIKSTGVEPLSAGKPEPAMFVQAAQAVNSSRPLAVGDRLDTDILGGNRAGMDTFLVLTGVSKQLALVEAPEEVRPTFIGESLAELSLDEQTLRPGPQGGFTARFDGQDILLERGDAQATSMQALRTVLEVAWALPSPPRFIRPGSDLAEAALESWS